MQQYSGQIHTSFRKQTQKRGQHLISFQPGLTHAGRDNLCKRMRAGIIYVPNNKVDVLHVRLTELDAIHQNLPFPPVEPSL